MMPSIRSAVFPAALCGLVLVLGVGAFAQAPNSLGPLTQGQPVVANTTGAMSATASSSPLYVDASRFTGDICARINSAIIAAFPGGATSTSPVATIDARALTGLQPCNSNPFTGGLNYPVRLLLGDAQIITSVPWWTPQLSHSIEGIVPADSSSANGTVILACGPGLPSSIWVQATFSCLVNSTSVPQFPTGPGAAKIASFNVPHGPFPLVIAPLAYACLICGGGQGAVVSMTFPGGEGNGWNNDASGEQISNLKLDLGGNSYIFGYYTLNESERSVSSNFRWSGCGSSTGPSVNSAGVFYDRTEAPTGVGNSNLSGTTRNVLRDVTMTGGPMGVDNSSCYGIVQEGANITITFTSCLTSPLAWITAVGAGGTISAGGYSFVSESGANCSNLGIPTTCQVTGAPPSYPPGTGDVMNATCNPTISSGKLTGLAISSSGGYPTGFSTGGLILENVNIFASTAAPSGTIAEGLWMEGVANPYVGHLHCQGMDGYCEHIGAGNPVQGGIFITHDTLDIALGLMRMGPAVDGNQTMISMAALGGAAQNIITNEQNSQYQTNTVNLTAGNYAGHIAQYSPGTHLANAYQRTFTLQTAALASQTLVNSAPSGTHLYELDATLAQANTGTGCGSTTGQVSLIVTFTDPSSPTSPFNATVPLEIAGTTTPALSNNLTLSSPITVSNQGRGRFLFSPLSGKPISLSTGYSPGSGCTVGEGQAYNLYGTLKSVY